MSLPNRGALASHVQSASIGGTASTGQSSMLQARISEKKAELAHLKELQALSAGLAGQMEKLESKLATLSDGTEAVATVLANWGSVLRAISMASSKLPKAKNGEPEPENQLPQTLVRIPTEPSILTPQGTSGTSNGQ